jgi:glyoxylase-like metal-dependent hydrolase (beta-lactamase superfamily II)
MKVIKIPPTGMLEMNGYLAVAPGGEAALIDAPPDAAAVLRIAGENGASVKKILLTHGHYDHIEGLAEIAGSTGAKVYIHPLDARMLSDPRANLSGAGGVSWSGVSEPAADGGVIELAGLKISVLHTPGHTPGSVCYAAGDVIFSGDTLFCLSVGRTDLPGGDGAAQAASLKKLAAYYEKHGDRKVLPGHDRETSLSFEVENNPYF